MNSYLGNKAGKIKKTSYLWLVVCAIFAASAGSVLIDYIRSGKEALDIVLAILMTGLFIWPIVRIIRNILFCRSAQKIAGWFYYYEEDEVRFEKLEKELGKNIVRKITLLIQKGYLKNLKSDLESGSIEIIASNKQVEDQIYEIKICPHCGAKKRTVKGRVCRCDFCDQII